MQDHNAAPAVLVNSTQRVSETRQVMQQIEEGEAEYIFLAPEQLRKEEPSRS
jgi:ATP-dependent DNA helicase RecQ